jgi:hypothetical protein
MNQWVLVLGLFSPGGDYMGKIPQFFPDQQSCIRNKELAENRTEPMPMTVKGVCVTYAHWTGQKPVKQEK